MAVAPTATAIVAEPGPERAIAPLQGKHAYLVADAQGHVWHGLVADGEILQAVMVRRQLDERGDALLKDLLRGIRRAACIAKRERRYELHSLLVDLAEKAARIRELDDAEDTHDVLIRSAAEGSQQSLGKANGTLGVLLGQAEAVS